MGTPSSSAAPGIALITGGGMGIGRAIALRLARDGWAVAFLVSPDSGFITAQVLTVDGGRMDYIGHP